MSDVKTASQMTLKELYFAMVEKHEALEQSLAEAKEENIRLRILLDKATNYKPKFNSYNFLVVDWDNAPIGNVNI